MNPRQIPGFIIIIASNSVEELAKKHGYTKMSFYRVIRGENPSSPIRQIIANTIGRAEEEIWPNHSEK